MSADPIQLSASQLQTGYRGRVITNATFSLEAGTVAALVGVNGCGKTTLLKTLLGLLPPLGGSITIAGISASEYRRQYGIGYLPEGVILPDQWTGRGLLSLAALAGGKGAWTALPAALDVAGVDFDARRRVGELSKGMRQRLALALTLIPEPRVLLLDEPEAGLDPAQRILLRERLRNYARAGRIVVAASHDVSGLAALADVAYVITDRTLQQISPHELSQPERVLQLLGRTAT